MNDYFATVKVQHGLLKKAMEDNGMKSVWDLSDASGVDKGRIYNLLNFKMLPIDCNGAWNESTLKICKALNCEPSDLFPEHLQHVMGSNSSSWYFDQRELVESLQSSLDPFERIANEELGSSLDEAMTRLSPRDRDVIRGKFYNNESLREIADKIGVTKQRAGMIIDESLRKLRHPAIIRELKKNLK